MMPISGVNTGAVQPVTTAEKVPGESRAQRPGEEGQGRQVRPIMDEYIPEEKRGRDEVWKCSTDRADREIEKLKRKQQELEQRLSTETDEAKIKELERKLAQVEQELKRKDSDTSRKKSDSFTQLYQGLFEK